MAALAEPELIQLEQSLSAAVEAQQLSPAADHNLRPWLREPYFAEYRPQLVELIQANNFAELDRLFWEKIPFGTGGRRGPMGDLGSATINRRTIAESAYGLGVYVKQTVGEKRWRAVIACDTRNRSDEFTRVSASVLAALGFEVFCFSQPRSTPELSFAVRHLECDTGIMITASHNPPADNGFKAYWSTGGQILAPHDKAIIQCVDTAGEIAQVDFDEAVRAGSIQLIDHDVDDAYLAAVKAISLSSARTISALFTPLHGVGETSVYRVVREAGFTGVRLYEPQCAQDGNFPNVPDQLPNPERPAVFQPAIQAAQGTDVALILASDPDADRLAAAVRDSAGVFQTLTGNQMGVLLTDYILGKRKAQGTLTPRHYVVETLVTTPMIAAIAKSYGVRAIDDLLVGFKYIAATMDAEGPDEFVFGTEESLGYLSGTYARDKDAAVAGLYALELAAELQAAGKTLVDRLDELYEIHGVYLEDQVSITCPGPQGNQQIAKMMQTFRQQPPEKLGDIRLTRVLDYQRHEIRAVPSNARIADLPQPSGDLMIAEGEINECQVRFALRPSGTEPKIKFYLFVHRPALRGGAVGGRELAVEVMAQARAVVRGWASSV